MMTEPAALPSMKAGVAEAVIAGVVAITPPYRELTLNAAMVREQSCLRECRLGDRAMLEFT